MNNDEMFTCWDCDNCIPLIDGWKCFECGKPVIVIKDGKPSEDYMKCEGKKWE